MGTDEEIQALADAGYNVGATIQDYNDYLARMAERQAAIDASKAAQRAAETGEARRPPGSACARASSQTPLPKS